MQAWKFYLKDEIDPTSIFVEVEEPIGWDKVSFTLKRSDNFIGLENLYTDSLEFYGTAFEMLRDAYETYGFEGSFIFRIEAYCAGVLEDSIETVIKLSTYLRVDNTVTVNVEDSSFDRTVKNRLSTSIDLSSNIGLDGTALSPIEKISIGAHSKQIRTTALFTVRPSFTTITIDGPDTTGRHVGPFALGANDMQRANEPLAFSNGPFYPDNSGDEDPSSSVFENETNFDIEIKVTGKIIFSPLNKLVLSVDGVATTVWYTGGFEYYYRVNGNNVLIATYPRVLKNTANQYTIDLNFTATVQPGQRLYIWCFDTYQNGGYTADYPGSSKISEGPEVYVYSTDTNFNFINESIYPASTIKGYYIYEAFNRITESISGELNSFRSDYFGRELSTPQAYDSNGCGSWTMLTNGLNIRRMLRKDGTEFPVTASFEELFNACNAVWNLGFRVETDSSGKKYIRVEPKSYFFNNDPLFSFDNISEIRTSPALNKIYNEFECGYENWRVGTGNLNFIDEFNSKRSYSIPIKNQKNKLSARCDYIAGGYSIELTRRVQYSNNPTSDFETDNNNFFICLNTEPVVSDLYTTPPVSTYYPVGTVSERDEKHFVGNYFSPHTAYNLRISPADNAQRWYNYLAPSAFKMSLPVKFQTGDGNYQEFHELGFDNCKISSGIVAQDQDILPMSLIDGRPLFIPNWFEADVPMTLSMFNAIKASSERALSISCGGKKNVGFIDEITYLPNVEGGIAALKLLESPCDFGEFDDSFDDSFSKKKC